MAKDAFKKMDPKHQGFVHRKDYLKMFSKLHGEEHTAAAFSAMDSDNVDKVKSRFSS